MSYVTAFMTAVPEQNKARYIEMARKSWGLFVDFGAIEMTECWEDNVPDGKVTSFPMAVKREAGEKVVVSWIRWPNRSSADHCFASMESDPRWQAMGEMPFDGMRMMWGGFEPIFSAQR